jgi:hypothetical protein
MPPGPVMPLLDWKLLTGWSVSPCGIGKTTTIDTYGHLTVEDARKTLEAAGWFTGRDVRL